MSHGLNWRWRANVIAGINGKPAAGRRDKLATGPMLLDTAKAIKAKLAQIQQFFPQGMKVIFLMTPRHSSSFLFTK
ncbi:hypothetical protein ACNKHW_02670 [Shigella flexneri]